MKKPTKRIEKDAIDRERARVVRRLSARFGRSVAAWDPVLCANQIACALDGDEDEARQMIDAGVFLRTVPVGISGRDVGVPRADLVRFLRAHGRRWFADRLEALVAGLE